MLSAFFSSSETAMMSFNRYRLRYLANGGKYSAILVEGLLKKTDELISIILLGNNFVNILASVITTLIALRFGGDYALALGTGLLTVVVLIFCEVVPKTFASKQPERIAFFSVYILVALKKIFFFITFLVNSFSKFILWVLGGDKTAPKLSLSAEQIRLVLQESHETVSSVIHQMAMNLMQLEKISVQKVMTPVHEIVGVDIMDSDEKIEFLLKNSPFDRLPVYREYTDDILGIIHIREAVALIQNFDRQQFLSLLEPSYFVPDQTSLSTQIINFREKKKSTAFVVDEYGTIKGLLTLDDILEEIVGGYTSNIADTVMHCEKTLEGAFILDGGYSIRDLENDHQLNFLDSPHTTVNGFILDVYGDVPPPFCCFKYNDMVIEILEANEKSILSVKIWPLSRD